MSSSDAPETPWLKWDSEGGIWRQGEGPLPAFNDCGFWRWQSSMPWPHVSYKLVEGSARGGEDVERVVGVRALLLQRGLKLAQSIVGLFQHLTRSRMAPQQQRQQNFDSQQPPRQLNIQLIKHAFFHRFLPRSKNRE